MGLSLARSAGLGGFRIFRSAIRKLIGFIASLSVRRPTWLSYMWFTHESMGLKLDWLIGPPMGL